MLNNFLATILVGLSASYLTHIFINGNVFKWLRKFIIVRWGGKVPTGENLFVLLENDQEVVPNWVSTLVYCPACISFWASMLFSLLACLTLGDFSAMVLITFGGAFLSKWLNQLQKY